MELLLSKHSNVNLQDNEGVTPLILAIRNQKTEGVKKLLSARSDISLLGNNGLDAFELCLTIEPKRAEYLNILDALTDYQNLDKNINVFFRKFWEYIKSNVSVADNETLDSVTCKILTTEEDVNVNLATNFDDSPVIYFCRHGCLQALRTLLRHKADVNHVGKLGMTALHHIINLTSQFEDRYAMTALLVKYGSNLNAASVTGERPLDVLVQNMIKDMNDLEVEEPKEDQCGLLTVNLSLLNLLVCGGADLCPVKPDTIEPKNRELSFRTMQPQNTNRSVLFVLISNGLFKTAEYLLRSGWDVKKEEWFDSFDVSKLDLKNITVDYNIYKRYEIGTRKAEFQSYLENIDTGPKSLANVCRNIIRHQLLMVSNGSEIETKISALPLPTKVKCFLSLKEFMNDDEIIQIKK
ncbi:unnamed protein product [Mytilus coruscus]|uniref:SOCS box domain-containing protein n=1 Tax=Mytilus coruscus TaxID=42192 RepID=A0A6J8DES2_MYTCO|nr:unnamed protein product [Mytilus coruscus]